MLKGRGVWSICRHIVLIALAIQATSPDSNDLTSLSFFRLFSVASDDDKSAAKLESAARGECVGDEQPATPSGESLPWKGDSRDDTPDEVCVPTRHEARSVERLRERGLFRAEYMSTGKPTWLIPIEPRRSPCPGDVMAAGNERIHVLCRLTC